MRAGKVGQSAWQIELSAFVAVFALGILAACETASEQSPLQATTVVPTLTVDDATPTPLSKYAMATEDAIRDAQYQTAVALTPPRDKRPGPLTPAATETIELGMSSLCGSRAKASDPVFISCWRGVIGGHFVDVQGGRLSYEGAE